MLTVTSEDVCWSIRNVKLDIRKSVIQCFVQFLMFVTAVCVLFVCSLFEPVKPRACHDFACVSCWKITYWNIKKLLPNFQKLLLKFLHIFILRSIYHFIPRVLFTVLRGGLNWSEKGENELKSKLERDFCQVDTAPLASIKVTSFVLFRLQVCSHLTRPQSHSLLSFVRGYGTVARKYSRPASRRREWSVYQAPVFWKTNFEKKKKPDCFAV